MKILIGTPWCDRPGYDKSYSIDSYIAAIKKLKVPNGCSITTVNTINHKGNISKFVKLSEVSNDVYAWSSKDSNCWQRYYETAVARQFILNKAKEYSCDYLLFVDSDNPIPKNSLELLLSYKGNIVSGWYAAKGTKRPMIYRYTNQLPPSKGCMDNEAWVHNGEGISINSNTVSDMEADWTGLGCCLIHRDVFSIINFEWNYFCMKHAEDAEYMYKAQLAGFGKVKVIGSLKVPHIDLWGGRW